MRILPRSGRIACACAIARLLRRAAGGIALDDENLRAFGRAVGAVGELPRQAELAHRGLARDVLFLAAADALLGALDHEVEELVGLRRIAGEPVIERVLDRLLDDPLRFGGGEPVLGLTLEFRLADEHREHGGGARHHVVRGDGGGALALTDALGVVLQPAGERGAQAGFVGAAVGRRDGVAIGIEEAVGVDGPGDRPLRRAVRAGLAGAAGKNVGHQRGAGERFGQIILEPVGEMKRRLFRHAVDAAQQLRRARPADFDAAEQVRLRARHLEDAFGLEMRLGAENLRVGPEAYFRPAPVRRLAGFLQFALRLAALEGHAVEPLAARDLDLHAFGQRVGDRHADAMQAAGSLIDLGVEFAAGVQRAHDHFERRLVLEFRVRIDRNAAAVVGDGDKAVRRHLDLDPVGMAGERLVHGIVDHLGEQVMQRLLVGAADIHAGAAADRLEPLQNLDMARGIGRFRRGAAQGGAAGAASRRAAARGSPRLANRSGVSDVRFRCFSHANSMWRRYWRN